MRRGGITDPMAKQWWRDYQALVRQGNGVGLSFVEYVAHRVLSLGSESVSDVASGPWYVSSCGHQHPWGVSCNNVTLSQ